MFGVLIYGANEYGNINDEIVSPEESVQIQIRQLNYNVAIKQIDNSVNIKAYNNYNEIKQI